MPVGGVSGVEVTKSPLEGESMAVPGDSQLGGMERTPMEVAAYGAVCWVKLAQSLCSAQWIQAPVSVSSKPAAVTLRGSLGGSESMLDLEHWR